MKVMVLSFYENEAVFICNEASRSALAAMSFSNQGF